MLPTCGADYGAGSPGIGFGILRHRIILPNKRGYCSMWCIGSSMWLRRLRRQSAALKNPYIIFLPAIRIPRFPRHPISRISPWFSGSFRAACGCMCIWLVSFPFSSFPFDWLVGWSGHVSLCGVCSVIYLSVPVRRVLRPEQSSQKCPGTRWHFLCIGDKDMEPNAPLIF